LEHYPKIKEAVPPEEVTTIKELKSDEEKWGLLSVLGLNTWLGALDDRARNPFMPYGLTGILVASAAVFFAYIRFDSISTHALDPRLALRVLRGLVGCGAGWAAVQARPPPAQGPAPESAAAGPVPPASPSVAAARGRGPLRAATGRRAAASREHTQRCTSGFFF